MNARVKRLKIAIVGLLPIGIQLSQQFDISMPLIVKSSICTVSVAVLSFSMALWGSFE